MLSSDYSERWKLHFEIQRRQRQEYFAFRSDRVFSRSSLQIVLFQHRKNVASESDKGDRGIMKNRNLHDNCTFPMMQQPTALNLFLFRITTTFC